MKEGIAMKRILTLLLAALVLCGCSAPTPSAGDHSGSADSADATEPTVVTLPSTESYPEDTGLVVKFEMGAEFEMVLSMYHAVLEVNPLNESGEALLAAIEPTGSYRHAVEIILEEAIRQEVLQRGMVINLAAYEVGDGAWTIAGHTILTWPIEHYQKSCGLNFACNLTPAGDFMDPDSYTNTATRDEGDYIITRCYNRDWQDMDSRIYDNGDYSELYYFSMVEFAGASYFADGSFNFWHESPVIKQSYTLDPDGSVEFVRELFDENGNPTHSTALTQDGYYYDDYFRDGILVRSIYNDPVTGLSYEQTYFENGNVASDIGETPEGGSYENEFYENGALKHGFSRNPDGTTYEEWYYENGKIRHTLTRYPDGTATEAYYDENGNPMDAPTES